MALYRTLTGDFPVIKPTIQVLAKVEHRNLDPATIAYHGPSLQQWHPQRSTLLQVVQVIHQEFVANPPTPKNLVRNPASSSNAPVADVKIPYPNL